jgi:hypothetical protein
MWGALSDERSGLCFSVVAGLRQRLNCLRERERERRECWGAVASERYYIWGVSKKTISSVLKIPRECPLDLLVGVKRMIEIN